MAAPLTVLGVVTCPRGCWKYQDAYRVAIYQPYRTRDGRMVWRNAGYAVGKSSEPQLRRYGYDTTPGARHNREMTPAEISAAVFAAAGLL